MSATVASGALASELRAWGWRGAVCAVPNLWWALVAGFYSPAELAGIAAGLVFWVVAFAAFSVWHGQRPRPGPARLVPALKTAAWLKGLLSLLGLGLYALCALAQSDSVIMGGGLFFAMPDWLPGIAAIRFVALLSGHDRLEKLDSFEWTAVTTVVDGAMVVLVIGCLALAVLGWWKLVAPLLQRRQICPARLAG